jgi:hypothetical protein
MSAPPAAVGSDRRGRLPQATGTSGRPWHSHYTPQVRPMRAGASTMEHPQMFISRPYQGKVYVAVPSSKDPRVVVWHFVPSSDRATFTVEPHEVPHWIRRRAHKALWRQRTAAAALVALVTNSTTAQAATIAPAGLCDYRLIIAIVAASLGALVSGLRSSPSCGWPTGRRTDLTLDRAVVTWHTLVAAAWALDRAPSPHGRNHLAGVGRADTF